MKTRPILTVAAMALMAVPTVVAARPDGNRHGGGGGINHNRPGGGGGIGSGSHNNNVNVNNRKNVNVNVNHNGGGYHGGGCCYGGGYHNDVWHAVGTAAAVTATVAVTSAVIGSVTTSRPTGCVPSTINGASYLQCGSNWYQPEYVGTEIRYVVVGVPR